MIEITPIKDLQREAEILERLQVEGDKPRVLMMTERGIELGLVATEIIEKRLIILEFDLLNSCDFDNLNLEEEFFVDSLMRSAASYGETNGADFIELKSNTYNKFLAKKGFTVTDTHAFAPMSLIVKYS